MTVPHAHAIWGLHGGYFLTSKSDLVSAIGLARAVLDAHPDFSYNLELEAFTLDRLARGPQLRVEEKALEGDWRDDDLLAFFRDHVQAGRMDNCSTYTQPILHAIDGESIVRQFAFARRIQRETLGVELQHYAAQEPCWCGQIPAILSGFNMTGCLYETSWGPFGFAPLREGESFRWHGPDGSEIRAVAATPSMRSTRLNRKEEAAGRHFEAWQNPFYEKLRSAAIAEARAAGLEHPLQICLSLDFTSGRPAEWYDPTRSVGEDCNVTFTTLGPYLALARDDGVWQDAFAEFEDRVDWGVAGGRLYLDSQTAANRTILAQRTSVLLGFDHREEEDRLWQATMVSQHHDCWFGSTHKFGHWDHEDYGALISACRQEVEDRADALIPAPEGSAFYVVNPTQRARREWMPLELGVTAGAMSGNPGIRDADGNPVPCRVAVCERHADGSPARIEGAMLVDVPAFARTDYRVGDAGEIAQLPVRVEQADEGWTIENDELKVAVSSEGIRLYRDGVEYVSDLFLHAMVDGWDERSSIREVEANLDEFGVGSARATGVIGCIPFDLEVRLRPWSDRFDIHVRCDYAGERTESVNYWQQEGSLKRVAEYPQPVSNLLHHPFELREPAPGIHSAVHYVLADRADAGGCALILDRPSGVVARERSTGIVLCHSGWSIHFNATRPDVKGTHGYRHSNSCVHGTVEYDVSLLPYTTGDRDHAPAACQQQAYPLQVTSDARGPLPIPAIDIAGRSVVSNLSREENGIVLRFWNPFEEETVVLKVPGMALALTDLEGGIIEELGTDEASIPIGPMQIRTVRMRHVAGPSRS